MKMSACWMFMILMGYRLSHAQAESTCSCNNQLQTVCVPAGDNVIVPCPKLTGEDVTFYLLKDQEVIYNHSSSHDKNGPNCKATYARLGVEVHENGDNKSASFRLTKVNASYNGIYRCEGTVTFPPPLIKVPSTLRILVNVAGHQCKDNKDCPERDEHENSVFPWIWTLVALLSIYSISATIVALINWVKLRRMDSQSDYMNTKPRAPRDRKKKRGVQTPIPRHF